ncbi:MAG: MFS transporter [Armatimonadetes bacterium]|nr:MFS transporter [Armatimonadota bacterium]
MSANRRTLAVLMAAIFLDLVGFGMLIPDFQLRAEKLGAKGWVIGAILSSLFIVQFVVSPLWGAMSDRRGRRPVLLACSALSAFAMLTYGFAGNLWIMLGSRIIGGFGAANVVVAQAYIADAFPPENRSVALGRLGAALQAGLILGAALAGLITKVFGSEIIGFVAAASSGLGVLLLFLFLPSVEVKQEEQPGKRPIINLALLKDVPALTPLFILAAVAWFALACLEGTFGRLIHHNLNYGQYEYGIVFSIESITGVAAQSFLLAPVQKLMSSRLMVVCGYLLQGLGLVLMPFAPSLAALVIFGACYSLGTSISSPAVNGACSTLTPEDRQGEMFGLMQGARSIGFVVGPLLGGALFDFRPASPYLLAGVVSLAAAFLAPFAIPKKRQAVA